MTGTPRCSLWTWLRVLRAQLSLPVLLSQTDETRIIAISAAINGGVAILIIALAAWLSGLPLLFPSLGPSAFLLFTRPFCTASAPRSVILGHTIAIGCGWTAWIAVSRLTGAPVSLPESGWPLCLSAILAFMMTSLLLMRLSCPHAPACASALIVATGAMTQWHELLVMLAAVFILAGQAMIIHRLAGVRGPLWHLQDNRDAAPKSRRPAA